MIPDMKKLLERLQKEKPDAPATAPVMAVRECQKAMDRAAAKIKMVRINLSILGSSCPKKE